MPPLKINQLPTFPPSDYEPVGLGMWLEAARRAGFRVQKSLGLPVK
jgi:hypothetical protein